MMPKSVTQLWDRHQLTIAGIGIELTCEDVRLAEDFAQRFYHGFLSSGCVDVRLQVRCAKLPQVRPDAVVFDAVRNHWRLSRLNGRFLFEIFDTIPLHPTVQLAWIAPDFTVGEIYLRPESDPRRSWSLTRLMRPFGELLLSNLLSQGRGVLVHGLGVKDRGDGLLFVGRSGAGKSTLANLYKPHADATILGDERVVVTKIGGSFWLCGTPWPGDASTVSAETVPLRKVFFLEHATRNVLISERFINVVGLFFQQLFLPFWNREALAFALAFVEELLRTLPAYRLGFVNDARAIEFLRRQGENGPANGD